MNCPLCGKPMSEESGFPGLWICSDGKIRLNDKPPFQFKCEGLVLTEEGEEEFLRKLRDVHLQRN